MRILITGGAGYLGCVLTEQLLEVGYSNVTVLDNFMHGQTSALNHLCHHDGLHIVNGDCRNTAALIRAGIHVADVIIHLAAIVGAPACNHNPEASSINVGAIQTLLNQILDRATRPLIIYPTTNSGYGIGQPGVSCTEETPLKPISDYGVQKKMAEDMIMSTGAGICLRLATAFGMSPRMRLDLLVNDFVYRAVNDRFVVLFEQDFRRNYIHVRDIARAIILCIQNQSNMRGQVYNVGLSTANMSKRELCEAIKHQVPDFVFMEAPVGEDPDKRDYAVSNAKIEAAGFKPLWSIDCGIAELIKGYAMLRRREFSNA